MAGYTGSQEFERRRQAGEDVMKKFYINDVYYKIEGMLDSAEKREDFLQSMSDELTYVYGDNWHLQFDKFEESTKGCNSGKYMAACTDYLYALLKPWGVAIMIAYTRDGALPYQEGKEFFVSVSTCVSTEDKQKREFARRALVIIEENLQKAHPDNCVMLVKNPYPSACKGSESYMWLSFAKAAVRDWRMPVDLPNYTKEKGEEILDASAKMNTDEQNSFIGWVGVGLLMFTIVICAIAFAVWFHEQYGDKFSTLPDIVICIAVIVSIVLIFVKLDPSTDYKDW